MPTPVDARTARKMLADLTVEVDSNVPEYKRSEFKHWITVTITNLIYPVVLRRDGTNVQTDPKTCKPISGTWVSPYDNVKTNSASSLDIDHIVPLKEAWVSGARKWDDARRKEFANDLTQPQLVAVTNRLNRSKGDRDVTGFLPPLQSYVCTYVRAWVQVKHSYGLGIDKAEKVTLERELAKCR
ncbi:hypothetical protein CVT24_010444 [Panaeolus cyanescens]|uniref:GmrSD restriction endonucleases C-terminal domain-containing protein n=1 Tax=Panaeolus cyanescens TaxID=181874 RepID=A0A409YPS9_9AGAR|nr:hypothetical protein CVT24_010444 [Panaeolus cyanescens]